MSIPRLSLLRARLLPAAIRPASHLARSTNRGSTCLGRPVFAARKLSVSSVLPVNKAECYATGSSQDYPSMTTAKTIRHNTGVKPGTEFSFYKIPPCLIPYGWTNDPYELEASLGWNLHDHYPSFPKTFSPVLSYMGVAASTACLISEGSPLDPDFYLITFDGEAFRLDTAIELLLLVVWMREHVRSLREENGGMHVGLEALLGHPELEWRRLDQDEWGEEVNTGNFLV